MAMMNVSVDPFAVEDASELQDWRLPLSFMKTRHTEKIEGQEPVQDNWRAKERMKTWSVALALCLNIGVDPPDVVKINPCARKECWIDPSSMSSQKALEAIGSNLQKQYERWQPRARYKQLLDPTTEDVRKLCIALRKNAKGERVLFHYNGHGVPKPTNNGEIWVFNKNYTQYIPLSVYDLQAWMSSPSIYIYDCSQAGLVLDSFKAFARQRDSEFFDEHPTKVNSSCLNLLSSCIQLAACGAKEMLPMNPNLPADLFSSCLTTPIKAAVLWYCLQKRKLVRTAAVDIVDKIPGRLNDRRTPLGELNWVFTAITDTIAWNTLSRELFQMLFRQDLLVASLFRNFLLAERIMRSYNCTPESHPFIPSTHTHPLWKAWDLTLDHIIAQIPAILEKKAVFDPSQFFAHQLVAFQVWLVDCSVPKSPPAQLPIILQFLLSQAHRLQALELLGRFLDQGPEAVNSALSVGIFPYVLKLLGCKLKVLQPILVFIWAKILSVDPTCQADLVKDGGHKYFIQILGDPSLQFEYRTMAAFVISMIINNYQKGQEVCLQSNVVAICLEQLEEPNPMLKQWLAICLGRLWKRYAPAKWCGVRDSAHEKLYKLLWDEVPEVRTAAVFALGSYIQSSSLEEEGGGVGGRGGESEHAASIDLSVGTTLLGLLGDGSSIVRKELTCAFHTMVLQYEKHFQITALKNTDLVSVGGGVEKSRSALPSSSSGYSTMSFDSRGTGGMDGEVSGAGSPSAAAAAGGKSKFPSLMKVGLPSEAVEQPQAGSVAMTPCSQSISSVGSASGSSSTGSSDERFIDSLPRKGPGTQTYASPATGSAVATPTGSRNVYAQIWKGLIFLATDPCPDVAEVAQKVIYGVHDKLRQTSQTVSITGGMLPAVNSVPVSPKDLLGIKSATLGSTYRKLNQTFHTSQSSQDMSNKHSINPNVSLPHSHQFGTKRTIFGKGPVKSDDEDEVWDEPAVVDGGFPRRAPPTHIVTQPIETQFCQWCCKYFAHSLMNQPEECDPVGTQYQEREFRFIRNHMVRLEGEKLQARSRLSDQMFINKEPKMPLVLKFHPYQPHLAVMHKNSWSIWEVEQGQKISTQSNSSTSTGKITAAEFINPHDISHLLTGSDDGSVMIWRDYDKETPTLVTAWRALTDMLPATRHAGMVLDWEQATGLLYASGDVRHIRVWDTHKELKIQDIPTGADSCVTCLTSEHSLTIAGCGDGTVRLYDRRQGPGSSLVHTLQKHSSWVVNVLTQQHQSDNNLVSCSVSGDVCIWDLRSSCPIRSFHIPPVLNVCDIHPRASLLACATAQQMIKIFNLDTDGVLSSIRYHDGFMGQRIGPTKCLAFHPYKVWLAAGGTDGFIAIYSTEKKKHF